MESKIVAWKCEVCGYVHEGPEPPDICPVCGVDAELFSPVRAEPSEQQQTPPEPTRQQAEVAWRCLVCGYVHEGPEPPDTCPVCGVDSSMFERVEVRKESEAAPVDGDRIVIVGGGVAAMMAAQSARQQSANARITMISREKDLPYYRLNLSRALAGEVPFDSLQLNPLSWFEQQRIEVMHGTVASIDRRARTVGLKDGSSVAYDKLVLANGAHPFLPPIPGVNRSGVHVVRTLDDVRAIAEIADEPNARFAVIGGGLLGLEVAAALSRRGAHVTVLEGFDWLLPRQLAQPAGDMLQAALESDKLVVRTGVHVKELAGDEDVRAVILDDDERIAVEGVVVATGVRPNKYLAMQCGLEVRRGVVVDDRMQTSDPDIYAAGDVAEHGGLVQGLWPVAMAQGQVAGTNAAGGDAAYRGLAPSNQLKVVDIELVSIGDPHAHDGSYIVYEKTEGDDYLRLVCRDGFFVGANLVGDTSLASQLREAIEGRVPISDLRHLTSTLDGFKQRCTSP